MKWGSCSNEIKNHFHLPFCRRLPASDTMPHIATVLLLTLAAAATASEAPGAVFIGGRVARPPGVDAASRPCVTMSALLHNGTTTTTQACDDGDSDDTNSSLPLLLRLPTTSPPPLAALVTAVDGAVDGAVH